MNKKQKQANILIALIVTLFIINYPFLDDLTEKFLSSNREQAKVLRIIDGDTIETNLGIIRLLGINTPERGEKYYAEAKSFLEQEITNKTIWLEKTKEEADRYDRLLRYVFLGNKNINIELINNGLANPYFPSGKDRYALKFYDSWKKCVGEGEKNLCENSDDKCADCIKLVKLDYNNDEVVLGNNCNFNCELTSWSIKDEGRKEFVFPKFTLKQNNELNIVVSKIEVDNTEGTIYWIRQDYVWTKSGDSLFLRDKEGKLVIK